MDNISIGLRCYTIILLISTLSFIAGSNVNCNGRAFHCVNSTHFKICVDLGHGVSTTVDEFLIPCPQNTVCKQYNLFECEYELTTTIPPVTIHSEVKNEQFKNIDIFPTKQPDGRELSEKYYNKVNATPASFTERFLTDAVIDSVNTSNANDLDTSSNGDINKTLNISRSTDKELTSITESGIDVTQSLYNINTLVTDMGVSTKYITETPVHFSTTQDRKTIVSFKTESMEPFNQNSFDLNASYTVKNRTNLVSSISEWRYSTATLLPGNFTDPSLQENTPGITNINHLIKSDNMSQDNLDILIKYNATQLNNSDNNTQYSNIKNSMYSKNTSTDIDTLNSNPFNVITDEILTSDVSDINKRSNVNSVIMLKPSGQRLAEITTASTIVVPGTTNQFSSHIPLNTEVIETFFNGGLNITTSLEKLSLSDGDMSSTAFIPETSVAEINDMFSQITKSSLNYGVSSVALTKPILDEKNTSSNKPQTSSTKSSKYGSDSKILKLKNEFEVNFTTELNSVNNSQYLTTTDHYFHEGSDIPISSASKSEVTSPIHTDKVLPIRSKGTSQVNNALQIKNVTTMESELLSIKTPEIQSNSSFLPRSDFSLFTTAATKTVRNDKIIVGDYSFTSVDVLPVLTTGEMPNGATSMKPLQVLISDNKPWTESVIVIGGTSLDSNNISITEQSNHITAELSNKVTSLKPISDLILKNETRLKPGMVTVATDLDKNNISTTEGSSDITVELSNGVTSLKQISDLISKNETRFKPGMVKVATDLDKNNISTTEGSSDITVELSNRVTSLKQISDLISKNETRFKPGMVTVATDLDKNNISTTEGSSDITVELSNRVTSLKQISDLISKNETRFKPGMVKVATDLDKNNISTTEGSSDITVELSNRVTSLKQISDLISKKATRLKPGMVTVATDLDKNNISTTEGSSDITVELSNGVKSLKQISDLISKNETRFKPGMVTFATDLDKNNISTTEGSSDITVELSNRVTSLKQISDLISKNETRFKPGMVTVATDLDKNNISTTEGSSDITVELSNRVTSLKQISDLISKNETRFKPGMVTVATDLDKNNISTTEGSSDITVELSNRVTSLKQISDLISKNETRFKPGMVTVATDLDKNNISTTEGSSDITVELSNRVTSLKQISDLISKNETRFKPGMVKVATDLDKNNISTTEGSSDITVELSNRVTSLKQISDLISKKATRLKPGMVTVATDLDKNNISTTEGSSDITVELSNGVTSLKQISDLISKKATRLKPGMVTVATDLDKNNISTTEGSSNITVELSNGVTSLKQISDLISKNETRFKPGMVTVATDLDKNNISTTEGSSDITVELSNGVTSLKQISDLISKNETRLKPVMVTVATDLDKNNITNTEGSSNITVELSNRVTSLKPISDLISKNETRFKPGMVTVATDLDKNNITNTEGSSNITAELSNGVINLISISDLVSKNETSPKPGMLTVATDLDKNNISTTEGSSDITVVLSNGVTSLKQISDLISKNETRLKPIMGTVVTDLDKNNISTTEGSSNITAELSNGVINLISISDLVSKNETSPKPVMVTVASNTFDSFHKENIFKTTSSIFQQSLDESTSRLSSLPKSLNNILKTEHFNKDSVGLISSTDSVIIDSERNITWIITNLPTNVEKPTTLTDKSLGVLDNNYTTYNNDTTKPNINPFYEINKVLSSNISDVNQTTTESDRAFITVESLTGPAVFESPKSMNVTNNTFIVIDVLSDHRAVSDINKNIENTPKLESSITTKPLTHFNSNKSSIHIISSHTKENVTTLSSQSAKNEIKMKQVIYNNSNQSQILGESSFVNPNLTKSTPENILIPKLVTGNNFSLSPAVHLTYINNNITDKNNNSLKDVEIKHHQVTNNLVEKLLTVGVINTYLNYPDKNVIPSVSNNSKSVPLIYLHNSLIKQPLIDIYSVNKTTASNKKQETENKDSSQTNKNGLVSAHVVSIKEHERNKTQYLLLNPYTQVNTTAIKVNDKSNSTTTIKSINTNNCTKCSKLSEISNSKLSGNVIKSLLIVQEPLQKVKNTSNLHPENGNLFSEDILNNREIINTTLVANGMKPTKTFTHQENVTEVNNFTIIRTTKKYINELNTSSESNITANNLLRNTSSQTNTIKNMTHDGMSSNGHQFSRIPSEFDKSSQSTGPLKMEKNHFVSDRNKLEIISQQEKFTISDQLNSNQSNGIEKKQLTNGHGHSESKLTISNGVTKNIRNNTQNSFTTPINEINYPNTHYGSLQTSQEFRCTKRGKFSDSKDCNKFFVCIGRVQPIIGVCPTDSVFSEYLKQCTKNVTHCIRNNEFKCTAAGRFINILCNNTYFFCAKKKSSFIRFTFQCQKGYYLDKNNIKCTPELKNISKSDENSSKNTRELFFDMSKEKEGVSINSKNVFECEKEGKFQNPQDCRKYYVCKKGRKSIYRRKIKQCDSDEVFHKKKKKCVDVESYECDI